MGKMSDKRLTCYQFNFFFSAPFFLACSVSLSRRFLSRLISISTLTNSLLSHTPPLNHSFCHALNNIRVVSTEPLHPPSSLMSSSASYTPVSTSDHIELETVQLDSTHSNDSSSRTSSSAPSVAKKRAMYSTACIEGRTPQQPNESDDAYRRRIRAQHMNAIFHSIGWVLAAAGIIYYTDLWNVVRYDTRVNL